MRRVCYWSWVSHSATKHVSRLCKQFTVKVEKLEATDVFPRDPGGRFGDSYVKRAREDKPGHDAPRSLPQQDIGVRRDRKMLKARATSSLHHDLSHGQTLPNNEI